MSSDSNLSFVNGLIAGAGAVLALMSYGFLQFIEGLEFLRSVSTTELRVGIMLGGIVCAVAIGYEFYNKKKPVNEQIEETEKNKKNVSNTEESINEHSSDE
ncbi:MAG: hypothetical protein NPMRTH4_1340007 [Nitrosopumilales archaeon]|nr:MAG: hypothetical protein NPMRTH4_1340007 [Nitrosopumilales archaeon]